MDVELVLSKLVGIGNLLWLPYHVVLVDGISLGSFDLPRGVVTKSKNHVGVTVAYSNHRVAVPASYFRNHVVVLVAQFHLLGLDVLKLLH